MMRWIVTSSLKFRFLVLALAAALMYFGIGQLRHMPIDVFPEFAPPLVEIQTEGIGMTSAEVEELITIPMEQSRTAYWKIRFKLISVPGVANVPIWGERIKLLAVEVDPERLRAHDVALSEVEKTVSGALEIGLLPYPTAAKSRTEGFIDTPNQRFTIRHILPLMGPENLSQVPVKVHDGRTVLLGDVAEVVWDTWPMIGDAVINEGPGLMLIVEKFPWANTLEVTRGVEAALAELRPGLPGIEID